MQRLTYVLFQLDEALRYISDGRMERLRLALLLLDNAAELQVARRVQDHLAIEEINERTRQQTLLMAELIPEAQAEMPDLLTELVAWKPLAKGQKRALERFFDEKLRFLSQRHQTLDPALAGVLSSLHRYRNEAYHEGRVRVDTVRTAALIYFEANCELLLSVFRVGSYSSSEDYSWLEERFGLRGPAWFGGGALSHIVAKLREPVPSNPRSSRRRPDRAPPQPDRRSPWGSRLHRGRIAASGSGRAARIAQLFAALERGNFEGDADPETYVGRWSIETLDETRQSIVSISRGVNRLRAFSSFADLEQQIEDFEEDVRPLITFVDRMVDEEIDHLRGK